MFEGHWVEDAAEDRQDDIAELIEEQDAEAGDQETDVFVLIDGTRTPGAEVNWDQYGVEVEFPDGDIQEYDWSQVTSIHRDEDGDVVIEFDDDTYVAIACRVVA